MTTWGRAAGRVDTVDLLMDLNLLCVAFCAVSALFTSDGVTLCQRYDGGESWQQVSGCSSASLKYWSLRGATD